MFLNRLSMMGSLFQDEPLVKLKVAFILKRIEIKSSCTEKQERLGKKVFEIKNSLELRPKKLILSYL